MFTSHQVLTNIHILPYTFQPQYFCRFYKFISVLVLSSVFSSLQNNLLFPDFFSLTNSLSSSNCSRINFKAVPFFCIKIRNIFSYKFQNFLLPNLIKHNEVLLARDFTISLIVKLHFLLHV